MGFLLPELNTIVYNCTPPSLFSRHPGQKTQKNPKQVSVLQYPDLIQHIKHAEVCLCFYWQHPTDPPSKELSSWTQFRTKWSKPCTGGSKSYSPFNGFCTPCLEAKDESSPDRMRTVMQALFTPPWRHSQRWKLAQQALQIKKCSKYGRYRGCKNNPAPFVYLHFF